MAKTTVSKRAATAFDIPLFPSIALGTVLCCGFYFLILLPQFRHPLVLRYALCHWVAIVSAWLFFTAMVYMGSKWFVLSRQNRLAIAAESLMNELVDHRAQWDLEPTMDGFRRAMSLQSLLRLQAPEILSSWFAQRIIGVVNRQVERRSIARLDEDLQNLSDRDADAQHASYAMVRINCWAMPMLGFLGTVIGISDTLGQMDAQALASGSQEAMNGLTSGLYVAFDTTAVGLVLTMIAMFAQFLVQRAEQAFLSRVDQGASSAMHRCLSEQEHSDTRDVEASLKLIASRLIESMQHLVQQQTELWRSSIVEAQAQWAQLTGRAVEVSIEAIETAMVHAMLEHRNAVRADLVQLVQLQSDGANQIDARLHQWQTTISEQARAALKQQQQLNINTELLERLLDSSQLIQSMQQPIQATLERMTDFDRFQEAAQGLTEAVMVLNTQLERAGHVGRQAVRRRTARESQLQLHPDAIDPSELGAGPDAPSHADTNEESIPIVLKLDAIAQAKKNQAPEKTGRSASPIDSNDRLKRKAG